MTRKIQPKYEPLPMSDEIGPVKAYIDMRLKDFGAKHLVVTIPEGTSAYQCGYRFASIPEIERDYYLANGASLVETV